MFNDGCVPLKINVKQCVSAASSGYPRERWLARKSRFARFFSLARLLWRPNDMIFVGEILTDTEEPSSDKCAACVRRVDYKVWLLKRPDGTGRTAPSAEMVEGVKVTLRRLLAGQPRRRKRASRRTPQSATTTTPTTTDPSER